MREHPGTGLGFTEVAYSLTEFIMSAFVGRFKPTITGLVSQEVKEEVAHFVELICDSPDANPKATVTWYKRPSKNSIDSTEIEISSGLDNKAGCKSRTAGYYFLQGKPGTPLIICKPEHPTYTGWYNCIAKNSEGSDSKDAEINILGEH